MQRPHLPRLFETGSTGYELSEEDGEFGLSVEMPGSTPKRSPSRRTGAPRHRPRARGRPAQPAPDLPPPVPFPEDADVEDITAEYTNDILEVGLPVETGAEVSGTEIEIQA